MVNLLHPHKRYTKHQQSKPTLNPHRTKNRLSTQVAQIARTILIFTIILVWSHPGLLAQKQLKHPMRIYQDSTGKIYVNLRQPLYFKVSPSPDPKQKKYLLTSQTTPQIVNPAYASHEGLNIVYTPWAIDTATKQHIYPLRDVEFYFYADGTPPKSVISFDQKPVKAKGKIIFKNGLKISLSATDNLSKVQATYKSIDYSDYQQYTTPFVISTSGKHTVKYYSVDNVGNVEAPKTFNFIIDAIAPKVSYTISGKYIKNILSPDAQIILKSYDSLSGTKNIYFSFDQNDTNIYHQPIKTRNIYEGWHTLYFFATDLVGNTSKPDSFKFFLDKTPPLILEDIIGNSYFVDNIQYLSANSKLKLKAIDNFAGVKAVFYSFDQKNWIKYTKPIPLPKEQKFVKIYYYAIDSVGNRSQVNEAMTEKSGVFTSYIDLTPPKISYSFTNTYKLGDTVFASKRSKIIISATDNQSGLSQINYQIDSGQTVKYTEPFTVYTEGEHKITISAFDNVNNMSLQQFTIKVDTTPPVAKIFFSLPARRTENGLQVFSPNVKIFIIAQDNIVGLKSIRVLLNDKPLGPNITSIWKLTPGKNTVTVITSDFLGNRNTQKFEFIVDKL